MALSGCVFFQDGENFSGADEEEVDLATGDMSRPGDMGGSGEPDQDVLPPVDQGEPDLPPPPEDMGSLVDASPDLDPPIEEDMGPDLPPSTSPISSVVVTQSPGSNAPGAADCLEVSCSEGLTLLGGGGAWDPTITIHTDTISSEDKGWILCGTSLSGAGFKTRTVASAICGTVSTKIETSRARKTLEEEESSCTRALCPEEMQVLSGGFDATPALEIQSSRPLKDAEGVGWMVCAKNTKDEDMMLNVSARCVAKDAEVTATIKRGTYVGGAPGQECSVASCPAGSIAVGGGSTHIDNVRRTQSRPTSDLKKWEVCGGGLREVENWSITALCVPDA